MKCPTCVDKLLMMSERQGVEIDYCPQCRGVWLDRGELDKLLERAAAQASPPAAQATEHRSDRISAAHYPQRDHELPHHEHKKHYKHKSWLSEIFD